MTRLTGPLTDQEYGKGFPVAYSAPLSEREMQIELAIQEAQETLPVGTVFEIRAKCMPRTEQDDIDWGLGWYHSPKGLGSESATEPLFRAPSHAPQLLFDALPSDDHSPKCLILARLAVE